MTDDVAVIGLDPPVVALITTVDVPWGVPGFELPPLLLPPHELSQSVENPRATIRLRKRRPRRELLRLREPMVNMIPNRPGSRAA